jgi:DNA-binding MarR family transcriptional regulator
MGSHVSQPRTGHSRAGAAAALNALRRLVQALRLSGIEAERDTGLSGAQLFVLQQLAFAPAQSLNELAERTRTHQSSVSVVVARLVGRGLVSRRHSDEDARRLVLELTPAGRTLVARAPETAQAKLLRSLERLPARVLRTLHASLDRLADELGAPAGPPALFFESPNEAAPRPRRKAR